MKQWWIGQQHAWREAYAALRREPLAWMAGVGVVATAVLLPVLLHWAIGILAPTARSIAADPEVSVYLTVDATPGDFREAQALIDEQVTALRAAYASARIVVTPVPKAQALEQFRAQAERIGNAAAFGALKDNPLPDGFVIRLAALPSGEIDAFAERVRTLPKVDVVQLDAQWVRRLAAVVRTASTLQWTLSVLFALVVVAVTFNATYAQVLALRDEIEVARLVGATNASIRRPFVVRGVMLGIAGAALALGIAALIARAGAGVFDADAAGAAAISWREVAVVLLVVAALGGAGGWWSATRQLRRVGV